MNNSNNNSGNNSQSKKSSLNKITVSSSWISASILIKDPSESYTKPPKSEILSFPRPKDESKTPSISISKAVNLKNSTNNLIALRRPTGHKKEKFNLKKRMNFFKYLFGMNTHRLFKRRPENLTNHHLLKDPKTQMLFKAVAFKKTADLSGNIETAFMTSIFEFFSIVTTMGLLTRRDYKPPSSIKLSLDLLNPIPVEEEFYVVIKLRRIGSNVTFVDGEFYDKNLIKCYSGKHLQVIEAELRARL